MEEGSAGATPAPKPQEVHVAEVEAPSSPSAVSTPADDSPAASEEGGERLSHEEPASEKAAEVAVGKQGETPEPLNVISPAVGSSPQADAEESSEQPSLPAPLVLPPEETVENGHAPTALDGPNMKDLMVDSVVATPEGTIHATVDMTSPSAAATHVTVDESELSSHDQANGDTDTETNGDANELPAENVDGAVEGTTELGEDEDGSGEHATIKEVIESSDSPEAPPTDEKVEQILARIRDKYVSRCWSSYGVVY